MLSNIARERIEKAAQAELESCQQAYGKKYASMHEAESVLREEVTEVEEATAELRKAFEVFYKESVRLVDTTVNTRHRLSMLYDFAEHVAQEAVQVMAVCNKAIITTHDHEIDAIDLLD